ncbi:DNA translocase FtsK [Acidicapsa ligni]|uniref:DNA translocase FtsK n=1 Tax=Acidicapsa ligni TaxID=542300 RepID=UPI0021DFB812|nr:DNA translocase FtsK [Acidicapsa ligni]
MKPIRLVPTPTRSRPLNLLLGAVLVLLAALLTLSLVSYHASDPSLNSASGITGPHAVRNWIGPTGAYLSDLLLQVLGLTAFGLPLWLGGLGLTWIRSRYNGAAWLRWTGVILTLAFFPAILGLLPWHWHWLHILPIEGVTGRLIADLLIRYLNTQGAWIVAAVFSCAGLYFGSNFSFQAAWGWSQERSIQLSALHDRWQNWQADRADRRAEEAAVREAERGPIDLSERMEEMSEAGSSARTKTGWFSGLFRRRQRSEEELLDEVPAVRRVGFSAAQDDEDLPASVRRPSIWDRREAEEAPAAQSEYPPLAVTEYQPEYRPDHRPEHRPEQVPITSRTANPAGGVTRMPSRNRAKDAASEAFEEAAELAPILPISERPLPDRVMPDRAIPEHAMPERAISERFVTERTIPEPAPTRLPMREHPTPRAEAPAENLTIHERADADLRTVTVAPKNVSGFKLPPSTLLHQGEEPLAIREDMLREEARKLVEKCGEFKVNGQVVQINPGPMVTTYEFKPDASVKYSRVAGLGDDLCLAMRAESILIERMAGKSTIGIQVPNHDRETIHLRDVIESETFAKAKSRLTLAMGKDINGRIVTADLAGMPHVLIAGSTGSGKSVAINAMIMSLLFRTTPAQVRLILVDPKRVELGMYEGIPHLFTPIITEAKLAANALRNAVREMERRLKLLASRSVRNIDQYNAKLSEQGMASLFTDAGEEETSLPYIVIIIDELADLMMLDRANVEESITRLAQMARAVGIHLILATQRPSVDVITGLIKANVPTRISFRLASKVDSRTIIDDNGAESLLGRGDMLFRPPGTSRLMRLHAPYVSEKETAAVVDFWKAQGEAEYVEGFLEAPREERAHGEGTGAAEDDNDELFDDAVRLVFEFGKASTSLLQRRLRIGYGRAAHLIDLMERDGLVGAPDGSRPRELLKHPGWLHEVSVSDE